MDIENEKVTKSTESQFGQEAHQSDGDRFDLEKLRLSQQFEELVGVKKEILTVPVRKQSRQDFFRVRPGEEWRLETCLLQLKEERETYLVSPTLWSELSGEVSPYVLFTTMNRQGVLSLWPIRLPGSDGRQDHWSRSALEAAGKAETRWIRLIANMSLGAYEVYEASTELPEPVWPNLEFRRILEIAFRDQFIESLNHPVIRRLRGLS